MQTESDRLQFEIKNINADIIQLKTTLSEHAKNVQAVNGTTQFTTSDGQSRLNQWKQANIDGNMDKVRELNFSVVLYFFF